MRTIALWLSTFMAFVSPAAFGAPPRVDYVLAPLIEHGALKSIQVDLAFRGNRRGETLLQLPDEWGGQPELWRGITDLRVIAGATMSDGADASHRVLRHRPGAQIRIRYRVIQDYPGDPIAGKGNPYRPVIRPSYFHLIGDAFLVRPDVEQNSPTHVNVRGLPRGWLYASDLDDPHLVISRASESITVGGDYRLVRGDDPRVRIAMRGTWKFSDSDFATRLNTIVAAERTFWGDRSTPYLVTVTQISAPNPASKSIGGTGLHNAFAFFATPNGELNEIARTLAHEGIHNWIPGRVGGLPDQDEAADYWFSEGFTEFYTGRLMVRGGVWTIADFAADLNETLRAYAQSPVRAEPNARVIADFWSNRDVQKLPYQRGRLLALIWDGQLREGGHSLDGVMKMMRTSARSDGQSKAARIFERTILEKRVDVRSDIATHIEQGAPILLPPDLLSPCGRISTRAAPSFSRGFDAEATAANQNIVRGTDPASPAYAAGLRDGMTLLRRDHGVIGDAEQEISYVIRDGDRERTISYMPRGIGTYTLQTFTIDENLAGEQLSRCRTILAGP